MPNIEQVVVEAAEKLTNAVNAYGPKATELVLEAGRMAALGDIVRGAVLLAASVVCFSMVALCLKKSNKLPEYSDLEPIYSIATLLLGVIGLFVSVVAAAYLSDIFAWIGLTHPEIYLAAKLLKL